MFNFSNQSNQFSPLDLNIKEVKFLVIEPASMSREDKEMMEQSIEINNALEIYKITSDAGQILVKGQYCATRGYRTATESKEGNILMIVIDTGVTNHEIDSQFEAFIDSFAKEISDGLTRFMEREISIITGSIVPEEDTTVKERLEAEFSCLLAMVHPRRRLVTGIGF